MYGDIPSVTKCCFCVPLRHGLLFWAYLKLITNIMLFVAASVWMVAFFIFAILFNGVFIIISMLVSLIILLFDIIFNVVFIVGVHKKNTTLLRLYYRFGIAYAIVCVTCGLVCIVYGLAKVNGSYNDSNIWRNAVTFASSISASMIIHCYLLILIRSEILKLKANADFKFVNHNVEPACMMQGTPDVQNIKEDEEEVK